MALFGGATSKRTGPTLRAPAPVTPTSLLAGTAAGLPPDAAAAQSSATLEATTAAKRARKKAAGGTLLTNPALAVAGTTPKAVLQPKSLVGY